MYFPSETASAHGTAIAPQTTAAASRRLGQVVSAIFCAFLGTAPPAQAVDGTLDVHNSAQQGNAGPDAYTQNLLESHAEASQLVPFGRSVQFRVGGHLRREDYDSRISGVETEFIRRTGEAQSTLDYGHRDFRLHFDALHLDQRKTGVGADFNRLWRNQLGTSAGYRGASFRLNASGLYTSSHLQYPDAPDSRLEEWSGTGAARSSIPRVGEFGYRISLLVDKNLEAHYRTDNTTHTVTYDGSHKLGGGRGFLSLHTNSVFLLAKQSNQAQPGGNFLRLPLNGGVLLDDTPDVQDPLEGEVVPVPELYDRNRQTPTSINLGDAAAPVHEFGGDYRNIEYDFGEAASLASAILYVNLPLLSPTLYRWRIFTSNDPEGQTWVELGTSAATATYREWGTGLQGWEVTFANPAPVRFFKMVDEKLGPTVPELFVTELETFTLEQEITEVGHSQTTNHRLNFASSYSFTRALRAGYDLIYHRRTISLQPGALDERVHGLFAGWTRGYWSVNGRYEAHWLRRLNARQRNSELQRFSARRGTRSGLTADLTLSRIREESDELRKTTRSGDLGILWPAAPALEIRGRVGVGRLDDRSLRTTSTSLYTYTSVTSTPVTTVTVDLARTDRWVSEEAGAGFSRFNDTALTIGWRPMPLVSLQSDLRYQVREHNDDWITRQSITWEALSRGSVKLSFNGVHFRDTQASETQRTGGVQFEWNARPSLTLRGSVESSVFTSAGVENSPVNTDVRGTWRF